MALKGSIDWTKSLSIYDNAVAAPLTGYRKGFYTVANGDGTVTGVDAYTSSDKVNIESYDANGNAVGFKTVDKELPIFGAFLDAGDSYYMAFGQTNSQQNDAQEVYRIVKYDRDWNRVGSVSVNGGDSYTAEPYRATVSRMAVSDDGKTVVLYAARTRYDGHQSNITIHMNASPFSIKKVQGEQFPDNHVSHSFGQFVRFDGSDMVTVDHGDAFPRSFVMQKGGKELDLLKIAGATGQNVTHAIGSGLEVSGDGYLFLGCSTPQKDYDAEGSTPWKVFLTYTDRNLNRTNIEWLTDGSESVNTARLVKLSDDEFIVMWKQSDGVHYMTVDGQGSAVSSESVMKDAYMPLTDPVVQNGKVMWIGADRKAGGAVFEIEP